MSENKEYLLILDTNFIYEHQKEFEKVYNELSKTADVYISRVTIQERKSQKWSDFKQKYDKITHYKSEISSIATIIEKEPFESFIKKQENETEKHYKRILGEKIIEFNPDIKIFNKILDRVYKKIPPFIKGDSDKGLKDTMWWLSILDYFKINKTDKKIILVTNDKGFKNATEELCVEFKKYTGLSIEVKDNSIYDELLGKNIKNFIKEEKIEFSEEKIHDLRGKIKEYINHLCYYEEYDTWGFLSSYTRFNLGTKISFEKAKLILENIEGLIQKSILSENILCDDFFGNDINIFCNKKHIPIEIIESLNTLYNQLKETKYLEPFIQELKNRLNELYDSKYDIQELPF